MQMEYIANAVCNYEHRAYYATYLYNIPSIFSCMKLTEEQMLFSDVIRL